MQCSPEKLAANRANSEHSTGPKIEAGKDVSRRNAIKHGLTGEGIALPDEDAVELEAACERHFREMKPKTQLGAALVANIALATIRLRRFHEAETAIVSQRVLDAGHAFDDAKVAKRDEAKARLLRDPAAQLSFQAGAAWVLEDWSALSLALASGT